MFVHFFLGRAHALSAFLALVLLPASFGELHARESVPFLQFARHSAGGPCAWRWDSWDGKVWNCLSEEKVAALLRSKRLPKAGVPQSWKLRSFPWNPPLHEAQKKGAPLQVVQWSDYPFGWKEGDSASLPAEKWIRQGLLWIELQRQLISNALSDSDPHGMVRRLLLDERPSMHEAYNDSSIDSAWMEHDFLRLSGWVHLLSASGIHILAWFAFVRWVCRSPPFRFFFKEQELKAIRLERFLGVFGGLFSWVLAGCRVGLIRPLLAIGVRAWANRAGVRARTWAPLSLALGLDLIFAFLIDFAGRGEWGMGRGHYALAVAGGLWGWDQTRALREQAQGLSVFTRLRAAGLSHASMAVFSWLWVVPLDVILGGTISPLTPGVSLISIPVLGGMVFPGLLFFCLVFFSGATSLATSGLSLLAEQTTRFCEALQWVVVKTGISFVILNPVSLGLGCILAWAFLSLFGRQGVRSLKGGLLLLGLLASRVLFALTGQTMLPQSSRVLQLDVGQGDAALVISNNGPEKWSGLIDAGRGSSLRASDWKRILAQEEVSSLQGVFLTHLDEDHAGGVVRLASVVRIECVVTSRGQWSSSKGRALRKALEFRVGQLVELEEVSKFPDDLKSVCLPPGSRWATLKESGAKRSAVKANENMSALSIPVGEEVEWISMGDASREAESIFGVWIAQFPKRLGVRRILKLSHHGSRHSSDREFLQLIQPDEVWVSVGVGNSYGHPSAEVFDRVTEVLGSIPIRRTDREGMLRSDALRAP